MSQNRGSRLRRYRAVNPDSLTIVLARYQEPTSWCQELSKISRDVCIVDKLQALGVNKGNEGTSYLHYILGHYDRLNDFTLFTHCEKRAWHYKFRLPSQLGFEITMMNLQGARADRSFYRNINWPRWGRRGGFWGFRVGSFLSEHPIPRVVDQEVFDGWRSTPLAGFEEFLREYVSPARWDSFTDGRGQLSFEFLRGETACACFFVSRASILRHPWSYYERLMDWGLGTSLEPYWPGRFFEFVWHVVFGPGKS